MRSEGETEIFSPKKDLRRSDIIGTYGMVEKEFDGLITQMENVKNEKLMDNAFKKFDKVMEDPTFDGCV